MSIQTKIRAALFGVALFASSLASAQQMVIERVGPVLAHPWGMDFLDADTVLVTERRGILWRIDLASGAARQVTGLPDVFAQRQGGLLDVAMADGYVFLCYSAKQDGGSATAIDRAVIEGDRLVRRQTIFIGNEATRSGHHFGCRLWFTAGHLYASLGDRGDRENGQNAASHAGSIIRIASNGDVPFDNPHNEGWAPENYSIGHRNPQGMAMHPGTGAIWTHEHGPRGGDEINIIQKGANYGWPQVSHGREYATGRRVTKYQSLSGYEDPVWVWVPSIAPSGMTFFPNDASGDMFPEFKGHLLVGSLKFRRLYLVELGSEAENNGLPKSERVIIDGDIGRIRDVAVAPHGRFAGSILLLSDESQGGLFMARRK